MSVHGVLLEVSGVGMLILGPSGIGKSESALDLVMRGHRLIADDMVVIRRMGDGSLEGRGADHSGAHMEIRGLGIINVKDLFGVASVLECKDVELVVNLCEWEELRDCDRLGLDDEFCELLDVRVPSLRIPVYHGRNIAVILEVAARNHLLKKGGCFTAREFEQALTRRLAGEGAGEEAFPGGKGVTGQPEFIVISGQSGSGKSTAVKAFEDLGSYCVDNLPTALLPKMLDLFSETTMDLKLVVLGMDIRERDFLKVFPSLFSDLKARGIPIRLLFFTAGEKVLVRRYSETRRIHPLGGSGSLVEAIRSEAEMLEPLRELADHVVDTSTMSLRDLREEVLGICRKSRVTQGLSITLLTFGYKYGLPFDTDLVFDVRFLPNPFFVEEMKHQTGLDDPVRDYLLEKPETAAFLKEFFRFLAFLLPRFQSDGRAYLTIGVGCTGGRHRSVVVARAAAEFLEKEGYETTVRNRDIQGD